MVWLLPLFAQGTGESAGRMESDGAGLQSQGGVEPGELREIDGDGQWKDQRFDGTQNPPFHNSQKVFTPPRAGLGVLLLAL